ncbi:MAG: rod shape-determining protein MreD [Candidatus Hydrogenedentes bacterium]|nr:rod shape-determining protein MreD [Candidatus Hydrogenedentota bacterium]
MADIGKNIIWLVIIVVTAIVQSTWPDALKLQSVLPDLTLILVVYFAITQGVERAMFTGLLGGIYQDVSSHDVLGHHVFCLVIVGYVTGRFATRLVTEHPAIKMGLVFCAGVIHGALYTAIQYVQEPSVSVATTLVASVVPAAFYTCLISPFVIMGLMWTFQRPRGLSSGVT